MDAVEIIEWIAREKLRELYDKCHVFLFPSHEGAGMVVAEALSYAIPVVCLDNAGPGEFIHPQSALKVPYQSYIKTVEELGKKLAVLYADATYYKKEQALARQRFNDFFEWSVRGDQLRQVYDSIKISRYSTTVQDIIPKLNKIG